MTRLAMILLFAAAASLGAQAQGGTGDDVPTTHRPPPGMCRIWIDGVPAGRQPAPTDCATAIRRRPPNARVIFGDEVRMQRGGEPRLPQAHAEEPRPIDPGSSQAQPTEQRGSDQRAAEPRSAEPRPVVPHTSEPGANDPRVARPPVRVPAPRVSEPGPRKPPPRPPRPRGRP